MKLKGRKKLLADAAGLGLTNILLEVVGLAFQLYLSGVLGTDGLGLFELISSVYILATTFATSGISMSVTRVVAEAMGRKEEASTINDIMKKAFLLSLALGLSAAVMLFSLSDLFAGILIQNVRTSDCFKILAVGLPFMSIGSCLNGFFIAERRQSRVLLYYRRFYKNSNSFYDFFTFSSSRCLDWLYRVDRGADCRRSIGLCHFAPDVFSRLAQTKAGRAKG